MQPRKKLTLITRHYFSAYNRKTTVHFLAREFVKRGYDIFFISVGRSRFSCINKQSSKNVPKDLFRDKFVEIEPGVNAIVMDELVHPISSSSGLVKALTSPKLLGYGKRIPKVVRESVIDSDIVLIECGYGVAYFDALKKLCKKAKFIYFATDPLSQVGLRQEFEDIELASVSQFDLVRVASHELGQRFPTSTNITVIPQGLDKSIFDNAKESPYSNGVVNFVSIGDMSFDFNSIVAMANLKPDALFHIFGADIPGECPSNIKLYGEVDFAKLVPYIKFADVGIMPYKMNAHMAYLTKTSLKFLQYSYCGLPIVTPIGPDWARASVYQYTPGDSATIEQALNSSIATSRDENLAYGILDWGDCAERLIHALA